MSLKQTVKTVWKGKSGTAATVQTFLVQVLILAINLATGIITARLLGPAGRGEQAALILWPQFLGYMLAMGLGPALLYELKKNPEDESKLFSAALLMGSILGLIATIIGIIFIPRWLSQYPQGTILLAQIFMLTAPISLLSLIALSAYRAQDKFSVVNKTDYLSPMLTLIGLLGLAVSSLVSPFTTALAYKLPYVGITCWKLSDLWKYYKPSFKGIKKSCKQLLSYGIRSAGTNVVNQVALRIDQAMVVGFLSPAAMGIYVVAVNFTRLLGPLNKSVLSVLLPKTAGKSVDKVLEITGRAARVNLFISSIEALAIIIIAPYLINILYGPDFSDAVIVFQILLVRKVVEGCSLVLLQAFMATGFPTVVTIIQLIGLGITFPLLILLIPKLGLVGAALSLLISASLRLMFSAACYPILIKVRPPSLIIKFSDFSYLLNALRGKKTKKEAI